jgi:2-polyprenyl-3-methyl-5-hydroxy-6-metoxy-1,4-benzoquinol methylase
MKDKAPQSPRSAGHYAKKQIDSRVPLLNWSHRGRFELACRLVEPYAGGRLLDYGCGDATFLEMVGTQFPDSTGANADLKEMEECERRFGNRPGPRLLATSDLASPEHSAAYDVVTCMEVLEHCVGGDIDAVLRDLARTVTPGGAVIISVPIETGPPLIAKQIVRRVAALRILDYKFNQRYTPREFFKMLLAGEKSAIQRPVYASATGQYHAHKGFNWRYMRRRVDETLQIERTAFSPLGWLGGIANSQAWFICRRRSAS